MHTKNSQQKITFHNICYLISFVLQSVKPQYSAFFSAAVATYSSKLGSAQISDNCIFLIIAAVQHSPQSSGSLGLLIQIYDHPFKVDTTL